MLADKRSKLYEEIEAHRGRPLVVYVTSKRNGIQAVMSMDVMPYLMDQLSLISPEKKEIDILIGGYGGDPMVSWRIMSWIRERVDKVSILVPQSAYSAATLLALGETRLLCIQTLISDR